MRRDEPAARAARIAAALDRLDRECRHLERTRRRHDAFLAAYLAQVMPPLQRLRSARGLVPAQETSTKPAEAIERIEANRLARRLIKACHPDLSTDAARHAWLPVILRAHRRGDLPTLWHAALAIDASERRSLPIEAMADRLAAARHAIEAGDGWRLMTHIESAVERGVDLVARIVEGLREECRHVDAGLAA